MRVIWACDIVLLNDHAIEVREGFRDGVKPLIREPLCHIFVTVA